MDASKKQREPVAFKSLAELKRFIRPGVEFKTVSHANHADMVGLTRAVTTVQTVGFYSKIKDQPEHPFSTCNHGKGFYTDFGKAGNYIFDSTTVKVKDMYRICGGDPEGKMSLLMDHTARPGSVADPWYTGDFEATWRDVLEGCQGLLKEFTTE